MKKKIEKALIILAIITSIPTFSGAMSYGMKEPFYTFSAISCLITSIGATALHFIKPKKNKEDE